MPGSKVKAKSEIKPNLLIKQEVPSRQQKSAKKGPKMYLLNGPNLILIISRFDVGRSL